MNPGDLVQLKCGGPVMVVDAVREDGLINCVWFNAASDLNIHRITPHLLAPFDPTLPPERPLSLEEQIVGMSLLDAIKFVQDATGKTLEEAKRYVQDLRK